MKTFWLGPAMIVVGCGCLGLALVAQASAEQNEAESRSRTSGLQNGWEQVIEIPEVKLPTGETFLRSAKITLWVEQGWLSVRRNDTDGAVEWQVALAQPTKDTLPIVDVDKASGGLALSIGKYFIREDLGRLRVLRQRKDSESPPWPKLEMKEPLAGSLGAAAMPAKSVELKGSFHGDWCWVMSGLRGDRYDVWLKLERKELRSRGHGTEGGATPARFFFGNHSVIDEGDLLVATRSPTEVSERVLSAQKLQKELGTKLAPAIVAGKWLNAPLALSLDKLHGKVVLLDFWGTWCGPCVKKLPDVEALHKKYKDRGLIVIGVHSAQAGDDVSSFLEKQPLSFPIAIDTGETAKSYGIDSWPTYFLIDKSGKAIWGFSSQPPSESQVEELLR